MKMKLLGVVAIGLMLTGCGGQMSKTEACQMYVQMEASSDSEAAAEMLKRLRAEAPSPMSDYLTVRSDWLLAPLDEKDPQTKSYAEAEKALAERVGFDRAIYCSS